MGQSNSSQPQNMESKPSSPPPASSTVASDRITAYLKQGNELLRHAVSLDEQQLCVQSLRHYEDAIQVFNEGCTEAAKLPADESISKLVQRMKYFRNEAQERCREIKRIYVPEGVNASSARKPVQAQPQARAASMTNITKQRQKQASVKPKQKEEEKPSVVTWDDVAGLAQAKQALYESAVLPAKRPDLFRGSGLRKPPRGILLYGPPGTGKTMLAKALAAEADLHFAAVSASTVLSKWVGESEKNIRDMFVAARECQPAVLFIDEIDSLLASRTEGEQDSVRRMKNEFLIQLDGVTSLKDDDRVLIVAATNRPFDLDEAALRRFPKRIYIPLPDEDARNALIRHLLKKESHSLKEADIQWLVRITAGFSCADITSMAREAAMVAVHEISRESMEHAQLRPIARSDFEVALQRIKPTVSKALLDKFEKWTRDFGMSGT